ncbi:MAG: tetratricopeptide repeat protein, partial [Thermoplasmata archaeon]
MRRAEEIARTVKSIALYHKREVREPEEKKSDYVLMYKSGTREAEELLMSADPSNPDTWIYRGNLRFESGDFESAIRCYDEALSLSPDNVAALYNKANALLQTGRNEEALKILEKLVENNPGIEEIWNNLGNIYARKGKIEEAVESYTRAIELNPDYIIARYNLGMVLAQKGEYAPAIEQFSQVLEREEMFEAYSAKASCEYAMQRFEEALNTVNRAISLNSKNVNAWLLRGAILAELEKTEDAFNTFKECMKINPENPEIYLAAGKLALKHQRLREAEEFLKNCVEHAPDYWVAWELLAEIEFQLERFDAAIYASERALSFSESQEHRWYLEYILGSSYFEKREFTEAKRLFESCIAENSSFPEAYVKLGFTLIELGKREEGLELLEKAMEMAPENLKVQYLVAKGKFELGEVEEASHILEKLIALNPDSDVFLLMGRILVLRGELEEAIKVFERAIDKNPANFEAWYYKGRALMESKELDKATAALELATQINPWHYNSYYYLAQAFEELQNYEKAAKCYEEILKFAPRDYQALFNLGRVYAKMEKLEEAEKALKKGFEVKGTYECGLMLGIVYEKLGRIEDTIESLEKAVEINPYGEEAYFELGKAYIEKKDYLKAAEKLEIAVKLARKTEHLKYLGIAYYHAGKIEEALAVFDGLDDIEARVYAAECALSLGNVERALTYLQSLPADTGIFNAWMLRGKCEENLGKFEEALYSYSKAIEVSPDLIEGWITKGNLLLKLGRDAEALECYNHILSREEKEEYLIKVAEIYINLKEYGRALETLEKARKLPGGEEKVLLWLEGIANLGLKEFARAREKFEKLLEIEERAEVHLRLASACTGMEDYQAAITHLEKYLETKPEDIDAWKMVSECYYAAGDTQKCLNALERCVELNPGLAGAWYNKGTVLLMLKRFEEAEKALLKAAELMPHDPKIWNNLGTAYLGMEKYGDALRAFEAAIAAELENAEAWFNKGMTLLRCGRHREAIQCFDKAVSINPEYIDALFIKGSAYFEMGEYQKAIECLDQFIERKPEHFEAVLLRGKAFFRLEKFKEAKEDFVRAISMDQTQLEPYKLAAKSCGMLLEWEEMERFASVAVEKKAEDAESWTLKAVASLNLGRLKNAVKFCEYAEELDKTLLDAYFVEAIARVLENDKTGAIKTLERCVVANPESARAAFLLASAHAKFGEREEALKWFRTAMTIEKSAEIFYSLAKFLYETEKYQECIEVLEGLKGLNGREHYLLGLAYNKTGELKKALHHFEKSLRENFMLGKLMVASVQYSLESYREALSSLEGLEIVEAKRLRGWIYGKLGLWEKAIEELEGFAKQNEIDCESAYVLALAHFSLKHLVEAKGYLDLAKGLMPGSAGNWLLMGRIKLLEAEIENSDVLRAEAVECFRKALTLMPDSMEVVFEIAKNLLLLGKERDALSVAEKLSMSGAMPHLLLAARIFERNERVEEALSCYRVVAEKNRNPEGFEGCARCYLKLGDYRRAIEFGERALVLDARSRALHSVAVAKLMLGHKDAPEFAEKAIENGFADETLLLAYGKLLFETNPEKLLKLFSENRELVKSLEASTLWARGLLKAGEKEKALEIVDKYLAKEEAPEVLMLRGEILETMGEVKDAITHYERAYQLRPSIPEICVALGRLYIKAGEKLRARAMLEQALSLNRNLWEAWYLLSLCSEGKERRECLEASLKCRESREAMLEYVRVLVEDGEPDVANSYLEKLGSIEGEAIVLAAKVKFMMGRVEDAEMLLAKLKEDSMEALELRAEIKMARGDYTGALKHYEKLLAFEKKFEALLGIARAYKALGNYEAAGEFYARALEINPAKEEVWEELAIIQFSRKMLEKLKKTLENYIRLNPQEYAPYYNLGLLLLGDGDLRGAEEAIRKSLAIEKNNEKAWNALGNVYLQRGELERAKDYFEKAVRINPNYWRGWYNLAIVSTKKRDFVQALAMVSNAEKIVPDNLEVGLLKGTLLLNQKKFREGERLFEKLYARNPE